MSLGRWVAEITQNSCLCRNHHFDDDCVVIPVHIYIFFQLIYTQDDLTEKTLVNEKLPWIAYAHMSWWKERIIR